MWIAPESDVIKVADVNWIFDTKYRLENVLQKKKGNSNIKIL